MQLDPRGQTRRVLAGVVFIVFTVSDVFQFKGTTCRLPSIGRKEDYRNEETNEVRGGAR